MNWPLLIVEKIKHVIIIIIIIIKQLYDVISHIIAKPVTFDNIQCGVRVSQ